MFRTVHLGFFGTLMPRSHIEHPLVANQGYQYIHVAAI